MSTRVRGKFQKLRASKFEYSGPATCAVLNESALKKKIFNAITMIVLQAY